MRCKYCNGELEDNARFCRYCGKKLDEAPVAPTAQVYNTNAPAAYHAESNVNSADSAGYNPQGNPGSTVNQSTNNPAPKKKGKPVILIVLAILLIPGLLIGLLLIGIIAYFVITGIDKSDKPAKENEVIMYEDEDEDEETTGDWYYAGTPSPPVTERPVDTEYDDYYDTIYEEETEIVETTAPETEYEEEIIYAENQKVVIAHGGLRIRNKPDLTYGAIVGLIPNGTLLTVDRVENNWAYVGVDGIYGWCSCDFLFEPYSYPGSPIYIATANYYKGVDLVPENHGTDPGFYTIIPDGESVYVYVIDGSRAFVKYNNIYGWCSTEHLTMQDLP